MYWVWSYHGCYEMGVAIDIIFYGMGVVIDMFAVLGVVIIFAMKWAWLLTVVMEWVWSLTWLLWSRCG